MKSLKSIYEEMEKIAEKVPIVTLPSSKAEITSGLQSMTVKSGKEADKYTEGMVCRAKTADGKNIGAIKILSIEKVPANQLYQHVPVADRVRLTNEGMKSTDEASILRFVPVSSLPVTEKKK